MPSAVRSTDEILKALGLSVQELPESVRTYIKALSAVASSLGISDSELTRCDRLPGSVGVNESSFYPAIREILNTHQSVSKRKEAEKDAYENLVVRLREAISILNEAQQLCVPRPNLSVSYNT